VVCGEELLGDLNGRKLHPLRAARRIQNWPFLMAATLRVNFRTIWQKSFPIILFEMKEVYLEYNNILKQPLKMGI